MTSPNQACCAVCNDIALSFRFGVSCCNSCALFFRRCLSTPAEIKMCENQGNCRYMKCQYCRFQRCLQAGMNVESGLVTMVERLQI
ncbi:hypothetical protein CRE_15991 [Caenorhabditis remanei]|uniref:Nuclear receptor domain-containing protein n=2 Tax=Caenorhabditis remanei TaxID=31234 RepID=E3MB68_CAERE|nr:hypothetical protein CRE_15991 [Caenorhabditis remanei]